MKRSLLSLTAFVLLSTSAVLAQPKPQPEFYFLAFNQSADQVRIELRAGTVHTLTLHPHGHGQIIFRFSGTAAGASYKCGGSVHNTTVHLSLKEPQSHFTIEPDCRSAIQYLPEPKG